jgi:hypothetical protein
MRDWEREVLDILREEIGSLHWGRLPENVAELERVAQRFGVAPCYLSGLKARESYLSETDLFIAPPSEHPLWHTVFLHELAEAALLWEGRPPYCYPPESTERARHRIAHQFTEDYA